MREPRTYLYVPGHRPDRFDKALASGADAVILDLEDAVPVPAKDAATADLRAFLARLAPGRVQVWCRINTGRRGLDDLEALSATGRLDGIVVPKATPDALRALAGTAPDLPRCALVESAEGIASVGTIAATQGVARLAVGEVDLAADLRLGSDPLPEVLWALRSQVVVAAAAAGLAPPIGPVSVELGDLDGLRGSTLALRRAGFWSRQVIHPSQVAPVHEVLTPTDAQLEEAEALLGRAVGADGGVFVGDDGRMVDEAVLRSARHLLALGGRTIRP